MRKLWIYTVTLLFFQQSYAQDTAIYKGMTVNLDEGIVEAKRIGFDVNSFIKRVEDDTTFIAPSKICTCSAIPPTMISAYMIRITKYRPL